MIDLVVRPTFDYASRLTFDLVARLALDYAVRVAARREAHAPAARLEALAVDDARAGLVVLLLRAPQVLERRERGEDRATDPDGVLALGRCNDLDLGMVSVRLVRAEESVKYLGWRRNSGSTTTKEHEPSSTTARAR